MSKYKFSAKNNAFFPADETAKYIAAGWVLDDLIDVSDEIFSEFTRDRNSEGLMRGSDKKGNPVWIDVPPLTYEQHVAIAESTKQSLITEANQKTQLWQTQLMLGIITDEDKASLTEWMLYVQKVQAVDTSAAPDIIWPEKPE
ncbi:tail fiber assembly protein [Morganella morganii]|uniref:tail fiber assembly protein n=1 Tax=Morganella morganii TaxID=582 RepID=UPI002231A96B|nr:tail fiber assembly protein [Morganella morganii]MDM8751092.1 tail fiber assembly protein [Morganella morganii]